MDIEHQLDFVARECGCEYGRDCTKTTVCAIDSALADQADRITELEAQLKDRHKRLNKMQKRNADLLEAVEDMDYVKNLRSQLEAVKQKAEYFIAEFEENWKEGRVSIDCKDACDGLRTAIGESEVG